MSLSQLNSNNQPTCMNPNRNEVSIETSDPELKMGGGRYPLKERKGPIRYASQYVLLNDEGEPLCYKEAMVHEHKEKWLSAMQDEMDSMHENYTYDLVELPKGKREPRNKWVYKVKTGEVDSAPRYKA